MPAASQWQNVGGLVPHRYQCAHCDRLVASEKGWFKSGPPSVICICPNCLCPTFFESPGSADARVVPAPKLGEAVGSLPAAVHRAYEEARSCTSSGAYTAAVMLCRKLLMHVAVEKGAKPGESFLAYLTYLETKNYVPPDGKGWVDRIRTLGNEANHELPQMTQADARDALEFVGHLLKSVYEFPARLKPPEKNKAGLATEHRSGKRTKKRTR